MKVLLHHCKSNALITVESKETVKTIFYIVLHNQT